MPRLVILSNSAEWRSPLRAMLRERGVELLEVDDALDALGALRESGGGLFVIHAELGPDEVAMALSAAAKRFPTGLTVIVAGPTTATFAPGVLLHREEAKFVGLCDLITSNLPADQRGNPAPGPAPRAEAAPAPSRFETQTRFDTPTRFESTTRFEAPRRYELEPSAYAAPADAGLPRLNSAHIQRLLHTARHGSYYALLGVTPQQSTEAAREAAINLLSQLSDEGVAPSVQENFGETLRELRAAVADARDVLSTPALRARYQPI